MRLDALIHIYPPTYATRMPTQIISNTLTSLPPVCAIHYSINSVSSQCTGSMEKKTGLSEVVDQTDRLLFSDPKQAHGIHDAQHGNACVGEDRHPHACDTECAKHQGDQFDSDRAVDILVRDFEDP